MADRRRRSRVASIVLAIGMLGAACGSTDLPDELSADTTTTTTLPPVPEPAFDAIDGETDGIACIGTRTGLSCRFGDSWQHFDRDNAPIFDWVQEIAICDDGTVLVPSVNGIGSYQGGIWSEIELDFAVSKPNAVACRDGVIWAGGSRYVARYDGTTWTSWDTEATLGVSDFVRTVDDIAIAPDGSAWVVTGTSVARWAADAWTVWEEGNGFDERYFMDAVAVDTAADGSYTVHVMTSRGFLRFTADAWVVDDAFLNGDDVIAVADGQVYVPAFQEGVTRYQGATSTDIGVAAGMSSDTVRGIAIDADGNPWFATSYGLTVFTSNGAQTYRVDNSELIDNETYSVALGPAAPPMPADSPEEWATITGVVVDENGVALPGVTVEACVSDQPDEFETATPCAEEPYQATTTTDADGRFSLPALRAGRYTIAMMSAKGWTTFVDGSTAIRFDAPDGEMSDLGEFAILPVVTDEPDDPAADEPVADDAVIDE